ncbi:MAG: DNA-directed RNA polymerase subunit alpha [Parcubacteria group bacterium]|nr:DNA-directed RNA polymerase subunit alpha [Parcubacteria group bacterium]
MEEIISPSKVSIKEDKGNEATIIIEPCYSGYGTTIGNALRRVLLSSLPGAAVSAIRIKGVDHEFSTIPNIKEDLMQIISNLKSLRLKLHSEEPVKLELHKKGKGEITAADIEKNSDAEIINTDLKIANATSSDTELDMEIVVEKGRGYVPLEQKNVNESEIGMLAIDSIFTPVLAVGFEVKNIRVGKRTDFDQLEMNVKTDGTIPPLEALVDSAKILIKQFSIISDVDKVEDLMKEIKKEEELKENEKSEKEENKEDEVSISELNFSTRTFNALDKAKIRNVNDLSKKKIEELLKLPGFGQTALNEVQKSLKKYDVQLEEK